MSKKETLKNNKYANKRKELLKEYMKLIMERDDINKEIRDVKTQMKAWDKYLLVE